MLPHYKPVEFEPSLKQKFNADHHDKVTLDPQQTISAFVLMAPHTDNDPSAYDLIDKFAQSHRLKTERDTGTRIIKVTGKIQDMEEAYEFCFTGWQSRKTGKVTRARHGVLFVSEAIRQSITAILGLDNRSVACPKIRKHPHLRAKALEDVMGTDAVGPKPLLARTVAEAYKFPLHLTGEGTTIGIIELGGGYNAADMQTYFDKIGIPVPKLLDVSVEGATNGYGAQDGSDGEVELDVEICGSIAPKAIQRVYFSPNTDSGFVNAIVQATQDGCKIISISWGGPEADWSKQAINAMNQVLADAHAKSVVVLVASGDGGSSDGLTGLNCDFPASSPYAVACGGTSLILSGTKIVSQTTWNDGPDGGGGGGGGVSAVNPLPSYQANVRVPKTSNNFAGRGVPDISGNADENTGYPIVSDGTWSVTGGTSAVAPLYAGFFALLASNGATLADIHQQLYSLPTTSIWDVRLGSNAIDGGGEYYAHKSWDPATGLGSLIGSDAVLHLK